MKIRRITLLILVLLTLLFMAEVRVVRFEDLAKRQQSIQFQVGPQRGDLRAQFKSATLSQPQGDWTSLVVKGRSGTIVVKSTDDPTITVHGTVFSSDESILEDWDVVASGRDTELSYELSGPTDSILQDIGVDYVVELPAGMEVRLEQEFGDIIVEDFVGYLDIYARYTDTVIVGLQGSVSVNGQFGDVNLERIAGPITLTNAYSTSHVGLVAIDGGYDFDVEVSYGSLKHNAGFAVDIERNKTTAHGQWGEGVHPVVIKSNFGSVTVNLDK